MFDTKTEREAAADAMPISAMVPRLEPEVAAKANVDSAEVLSENFLSAVNMVARGNAWIMSALRPATGILFSNSPETSASDRLWHRAETIAVGTGTSRYAGSMENVEEFLQNNLFASAKKNPLLAVTGIDIKGIKIVPKKKGDKGKVDRGTGAIKLNILGAVGGLSMGWTYHEGIVDRQGNVVAGVERTRRTWTEEEEAKARKTRAQSRADIHEAAKSAFSRVFPDMGKFPFKPGQKAEYTIPLSYMAKNDASSESVMDTRSAKAIEYPAAFKAIEDNCKISFIVTITNVTNEDDELASHFHINIETVMHVPINLFYHITDTDPSAGEINRALIFLWVGEALRRQFSAMSPKKRATKRRGGGGDEEAVENVWPIKISDPLAMKKRIEHEVTVRGAAAKPRTDNRGWSVTEDGEFFLFKDKGLHGQALVDYVGEISVKLSQLETEKNRDTRLQLLDDLNAAREKLKGKVVVADWAHDTLVKVNTVGNFELESLRGYSVPTASDELLIMRMGIESRRLATHYTAAIKCVSDALRGARLEATREMGERLPNATEEAYEIENKRIRERFPDFGRDEIAMAGYAIDSFCQKYSFTMTPAVLAGHDLDKVPMADTTTGQQMLSACATIRKAFHAAVEIGLDKVFADRPDETRLGLARWLVETIGNTTSDRFTALNQLDQEERLKNTPGPLPDGFVVPNIGNISTLPHQTEILSISAKCPRNHFIAVGTGGGKTVIALLDALTLLKNNAKRVIYFTEGGLNPQMISEVNKFSGGKVNAVPFSPDIVRRMKDQGIFKTSDDVVKWVKSFPPNTLFVAETLSISSTDHAKKKRGQVGAEDPKQRFSKLFEDEPDSIHYMMQGKVLRQFAEIALRCEFDAVFIDEAQRVRGLQGRTPTNVGGAARRFNSRALYRRELTGTQAHNNPEDPVKLALTLAPTMFGSLDEAVATYKLRQREGSTDGLRQLGDMLGGGFIAYSNKTREDWSFALPSMKTDFVYAKLTPRQSMFYEKIMADIIMRFEAGDVELKGDMAEGEAEAVKADAENDGDDANGDDNENGEGDTVIVGGKKVKEAKLRLMFEPVRQFLVAPDRLVVRNGVKGQRNDYMQTVEDGETPTGTDLMSPHVDVVGRLIQEHLKTPNAGKILVFGQNKCTSEHLERWLPKRFPDLASLMLRYTVNTKGALDRFKTDDQYRVLLADMESMKAGHNLQMVDLIIRTQTPWTPGDVEQSTARMYRPDFSGLRLASNVRQIWSILETKDGGATLDHMMAARVFQKQLAVSELRYRDRSSVNARALNDAWEKFATDRLPRGEQPFKMSPEIIRGFRKEDAQPFFSARDALDEFENSESRKRRLQMAINIERMTGKSIIDHATGILKGAEGIKTFLEHTMTRLAEGHTLPGSKDVFKCWLPRIDIPDPQKLGLNLPLSEDEAQHRLKEKMPVMTEFGPGVVKKIARNGKVTVTTGIGDMVIDPMLIAIASESGTPELAKMAKNMKAHVKVPFGMKPTSLVRADAEDAVVDEVTPPAPKKAGKRRIVDEPPVPQTPAVDEEEESQVKIEAGIIDGMPAFILTDPEINFVDDIPGGRWHKIGDFLNLSFINPAALQAFVDEVTNENNEVIITDPVRAKAIRGQAAIYVKRKSLRATKAPSSPITTKLFTELLTAKMPKTKGKPNHLPHLLSIGVEVRMIYLLRTLTPAVKAEILRIARSMSGKVRIESKNNPGFRLALFPTVSAMSTGIQKLKTYAGKESIAINDRVLAESVAAAKKLYAKMENPSKLVEETEKKVAETRKEAEKLAKKTAKVKVEEEAPAPSKKEAKGAVKKAKESDAKKATKATKATKSSKSKTAKAVEKAPAKKTPKAKAGEKKAAVKPAAKKTAKKAAAKKPAAAKKTAKKAAPAPAPKPKRVASSRKAARPQASASA